MLGWNLLGYCCAETRKRERSDDINVFRGCVVATPDEYYCGNNLRTLADLLVQVGNERKQ